MQRVQAREVPERISWARAMIFGVGFFFIAAILIGQLPSYISLQMTAASLVGTEQGFLALGLICLAGFVVVQVIVLLFDPKPVVPPIIFAGLGPLLFLAGLALLLWSVLTVHVSTIGKQTIYSNNQYFPQAGFTWNSLLSGSFLWLHNEAIDFVTVATVVMGVGAALLFYGFLALREQNNPDRSDPGTTGVIRLLIAIATVMLIAYMIFLTFVDTKALANAIYPACPLATSPTCGPITGLFIVNMIFAIFLSVAVLCTLWAFALRLHYLMRPVRSRTMSALYAVGVNLAPIGAIFLLLWLLIYPAIDWIHSWSLIGLGDYLTVCGKLTDIPGSCAFSQDGGYIIDTIVTSNFFLLLMAAIWAWKSNRNLVVIGSVVVTAVLALATLVVHLHPDEALYGFLLCGGALILATIWTSVARREFAIVGERNLGCIGMWLVVGTCLLIYLAAFAFFSIPGFRESAPNVPFVPGLSLPGKGSMPDAVVAVAILGTLAALQFYFLVRNRYKV
ncbi:MAG: hypothetical protein H0W02_19895 [Ktedonobacteraceae bacterium]|nr:hypothetical protein [Ktedonobacteraceae bacterium]